MVSVLARKVAIGVLFEADMPDGSVLTSDDLSRVRIEAARHGCGVAVVVHPESAGVRFVMSEDAHCSERKVDEWPNVKNAIDTVVDAIDGSKTAFQPDSRWPHVPNPLEVRKMLWEEHGHDERVRSNGVMYCHACAVEDYSRAPFLLLVMQVHKLQQERISNLTKEVHYP